MRIYFFVLISCLVLKSNAQTSSKTETTSSSSSFKEGTFTFDGGMGVDYYGLKIHTQVGKSKFDTIGKMAGVHFPFKFEYGASKNVGVGARLSFSEFIDARDTTYKPSIKPRTSSFDFGIIFNIHLYNNATFDIPLCVNLGYSKINIALNDSLHNKTKSEGLAFGLTLTPRIYFTKHFGMCFNIGYMRYNYAKFIYSNDKEPDLNSKYQFGRSIKAQGVNLGFGLITKF